MAIETGADGIEMDVRLARDGVPVVIHDANLRRTGLRNDRVSDLTSDELGGIDIGSWFNARAPYRARAEFCDETVPTLAQVLALASDVAGPVYVELKFAPGPVAPLVKAVCDVLDDSPIRDRVIVKSFRLEGIEQVRRIHPGLKTAALFEPSMSTLLRPRAMITAALDSGAGHISLHRSLARRPLIRLARAHGLAVTLWTVDGPKWANWGVENDIFALVTNDPAPLLAATAALARP